MTSHLRLLGNLGGKAFFCGLAFLITASVWADAPRVVSVEEHWELQISQPDPNSSAPQTTMVMSPSGDVGGAYFLFTLNHSNVPDFTPGGMQVQLWDGTNLVEHHVANERSTLSHDEEVVTWVQRMTLDDGTLTFEISAGSSETWGSFGGHDLTLSTPSTLTGLNSYLPAVSLSESGVSFAENRVVSLVLKKLVWVTEDGVVHEQNAPIPIDTTLN
jgi:hypothetical protein